jgi:hypothetical protein
MANMSYCRFRNTLEDLRDCLSNIYDTEDLSKEETQARHYLIKVCADILDSVGDEIDCELSYN